MAAHSLNLPLVRRQGFIPLTNEKGIGLKEKQFSTLKLI